MSNVATVTPAEFPIERWTMGPDAEPHHLALHLLSDGLHGYCDGTEVAWSEFAVRAMSSPRESQGRLETIPRPTQKDNDWVSGRFVNHQGKRHLTLSKHGTAVPLGFLDGTPISLEAVAYLALACPLWDRQMRLASTWTAPSPTASPAG